MPAKRVIARLVSGETHLAVVSGHKTDYGIGHGHANAVVAYATAELAK